MPKTCLQGDLRSERYVGAAPAAGRWTSEHTSASAAVLAGKPLRHHRLHFISRMRTCELQGRDDADEDAAKHGCDEIKLVRTELIRIVR